MGSIKGVVSIGDSPFRGAQVTIAGPGAPRTAISGTDGSFAFAELSPGVYVVTTSIADVRCGSVTADLKAGETVSTRIDCTLVQPVGTAGIVGVVTAGGAPLGGAQVSLVGLPFTGALAERAVTAGTAGHFTFNGLPGGTYTLSASATGFSCVSPAIDLQAGETATVNISCTIDDAGEGESPAPSTPEVTGRIAFERNGRIMILVLESHTLTTFMDGLSPSWSVDGGRLVFQRPGCLDRSVPPYTNCDDVWIVNADGSGLSAITNSEYVHDHDPVWSPDGSKVAFVRLWHGPDQDYLVVADVDPPPALWSETVPSLWWPYARPTWSPDGARIAFTCQGPSPHWEFDICVVPSNTKGGYFNNSPGVNAGLFKIMNDTWINSDPAWSPDGARIAFTTNRDAPDGRSHIALIAPDGSGFTRLVPGHRPAWSPNGSRIVFVGEADAPGLYVVNADGTGLARITDDPADDSPSWGR